MTLKLLSQGPPRGKGEENSHHFCFPKQNADQSLRWLTHIWRPRSPNNATLAKILCDTFSSLQTAASLGKGIICTQLELN